ncbi:MAG: SIS domain-containing protein [Novosphingobium sp.]
MPHMSLAEPETAADCWTLREIRQQPETLRAVQAVLDAERAGIDAFLAPLLADPARRVILTGAGTSAFIGQSLAPTLSSDLGRVVEAVATTDIVGAPDLHLRRTIPTLLVSFGRSGSSPESLAALDLANAMVDDIHHLIITCNAGGQLAARSSSDAAGARTKVVILPEETHDRGFAMTSSFTGMMLAALASFSGIAAFAARTPAIADGVATMTMRADPVMTALAARGFNRVVYLGSGGFSGLAREAALKLMELSDGALVTAFDSTLGFRHGPKTIITPETLVVVFIANDPHTRRYDRDMLAELIADGRCGAVLAVSTEPEAAETLVLGEMAGAADCDLLFPYIVPAQLLALRVSYALGLTPDQPNRSGTVNRVVQGVRIYTPAA